MLDLIFPKYCVDCRKIGSYLCQECTEQIEYLETQYCSYCYKPAISGKTHPTCSRKLGLDGIVSLANYAGPVKALAKSLKYRFTTDLLTEFSQKFRFEKPSFNFPDFILVPLPLHRQRQNYRGFNQAELLGKVVAQKFGLAFKLDLLTRERSTQAQVGLSQRDRKENMAGVFEVNQKVLTGNYCVFDDVWTSGASLKEAAKVLKKAGAAEVWGLTLAHPR